MAMERITELLAMGTKLGLRKEVLQEYVLSIQAEERDARAREREANAKEVERKFALQEQELTKQKLSMEIDLQTRQGKEAEKEFQRKKELLALQAIVDQESVTPQEVVSSNRYIPKLPPFDEQKDDIDVYLTRFETFAKSQKWMDERRAVGLSALLQGKALGVYSRLGPD